MEEALSAIGFCRKLVQILFFITLLFATQIDAAFPAPPSLGEGEWILTGAPGTRWESVSRELSSQLTWIETFGPNNRFALFRQKKNRRRSELDLRQPLFRRALAQVRTLQKNYRYRFLNNDPEFGKSWALENTGQDLGHGAGVIGKDIGAVPAWSIHQGDGSIVVAVIDSGIELTHEDLREQIWHNPKEIPHNAIDDDSNGFIDDVSGWNFSSENNDASDDDGHGTMCAGIIGAQWENGKGSRGINRRVQLMSVKALYKGGAGSTVSTIKAIQYAVNNGAQVINASWGGYEYDQALFETIRWAGKKGVLFVAAAGNDGIDLDRGNKRVFPASFRLPNLISVAAYDNKGNLAKSSNFGKRAVDIGAPGVDIFSTTLGGYRLGDGTSFSAPFVSGVAALVRSWIPQIGVDDLRIRLLESSQVVSYYEKERVASAGIVNAVNALRNERPPRPKAPKNWARQADGNSTSHPYLNNTLEKYSFSHLGATHLRVHFSKFQTEECCDIVTIKDSQGRTVTRYSGNLGAFYSDDVLGDRFEIEFRSDDTMSDYGFDIDYFEWSLDDDLWARRERDRFPLPRTFGLHLPEEAAMPGRFPPRVLHGVSGRVSDRLLQRFSPNLE